MDCGVSVFAELAGLSRDEILNEMPEALNGLSADQAIAYLKRKGLPARNYPPNSSHPLPCAHLVLSGGGYHWVYQAANGGIHDPSPVFEWTPPRTITLSTHYSAKILTIALEPPD
jgi:hypothetical protein